ncbi:Dyp-type peroxidase [Corynebacterium sp. H127]|uniref:Dyp-type peroxidase n=1 Tax=Corynebacterium sp. H127 TaxID=3133418 RepID=UPI003094D5E4
MISRRSFLGAGALGLGAAGLGFGAARLTPSASSEPVPFRGQHQSGILTPAQQQMILVAFDMTATLREDLIDLLTKWTTAAERMQAGELINTPKARRDVPPDDTGEAMGYSAASLSITFGFGASLFEHSTKGDRYQLAHRMPEPLRGGIPRMSAEYLNQDASHGDLIIQICGEDPMVVLHALHQFKRIAFGLASVRWVQLGYGRTSSTSEDQETPRNLFGFKDGTSNIVAEEPDSELNKHLWISDGSWADGGSYLCLRKIKMMMEVWDELSLDTQENVFGRDKNEGAPLSGGEEFTPPEFQHPAMDPKSHVTLMHPSNNGGARMLRRGYNYTEGIDYLGRLNAGLVFIAYVANPQTNFIPVLSRMTDDLLTEYIQHVATGLYLVPGGIKEGDNFVGQALFDA